jgi:hypothetical protein
MTTYLLVHGGWVGGWVWDDMVPLLAAAGHPVLVVDQLPSSGRDPTTLGDLSADAAYVRKLLDDLDDSVILVGLSSGGLAITEVADHPRIRHSVYVAAFWPARGQSVLDLTGKGPLPAWVVLRDDGALAISDDLDVAHEALCADIDRDRAVQFLSKLVLQSGAVLASVSTAPDRSHPTTYVVCERDNAVPVPAQEAMSTKADHVARLPSSHMVQLSMPYRLVEVLKEI